MGNRPYSPYSPVRYDIYGTNEGIISAHFQDWSGETCINLMNFFGQTRFVRNRIYRM